jgi:hypothetical protein
MDQKSKRPSGEEKDGTDATSPVFSGGTAAADLF